MTPLQRAARRAASPPSGGRGTTAAGPLARWRLGTRVFLTAVWVMLWRDLSVGNVAAGLLLASLIVALVPFPPAVFALTLRPWPFLVLVARFLSDVVRASLEVAYSSVAPWRQPVGRFVDVQLRASQDLPRTLTAELTSLVPGSLVVDLDPATGRLTLHLFDVPTPADVEAAVRRVHDQERRLMRALFVEEVP